MVKAPMRKPSRGFYGLIAAGIITALLWRLPYGAYILYPFTIMALWFHEMAHGLMAMILGGSFTKLLIFYDGSGMAHYTGPLAMGRFGSALVAAAGPLGPSVAGAVLIGVSKRPRRASLGIYCLATLMLISAIVWIRSLYGLIMIPLLAAALLVTASRTSIQTRVFAAQFLGVQACVSAFRQIDYLFSSNAGPTGLSDTAMIQKALILPYWFWGALITIGCLALLLAGLRMAYR
jgi:hypothetical protein